MTRGNGNTPAETAFIGLGSNVGDRLSYLRHAVVELVLVDGISFVCSSSVYATEPVGPPQPDFLNAVIEIDCTLSPLELLGACKRIERDVGRVSRGRWSQREVDLDILLLGEQSFSGAELTLPHPLLEDRGFVLVPLSDIAPALVLPSGTPLLRRVEQVGRDGVHFAHAQETLWPPP